jgi:predicted GH43/DUF377 family glycosyl hydrolase
MMKNTLLRDQLQAKLNDYLRRRPSYFGLTGDGQGNFAVSSDTRYIYVRDFAGVVHTPLNRGVPTDREYVVEVGFDERNPSIEMVLDVVNVWPADPLGGAMTAHHETHEWPGGNDVVWIAGGQIVPGLVIAKVAMKVSIFPFWKPRADGTYVFIPYQEMDLTDYRPTSSGAWWALLSFDDDGDLHIKTGTLVASWAALSSTVIPAPDDRSYSRLAAVALGYGQTDIVQNAITNQIADLRWLSRGAGSALGGSRYMALYNYVAETSGTYHYRIGQLYSEDLREWQRGVHPAINLGSGGAWDDEHVKDACVLDVDGVLYCYYSGYDGTRGRIGLARSFDRGLTWVKYSGNPILSQSQGWENSGIYQVVNPSVLYEADEPDASKRWKMWYTGGDAVGVGYAYSADGLTWTKFGSNPVLVRGSGAEWDELYVTSNAIIKVGDIYQMLYGGAETISGLGRWGSGLATFEDPEGSYVKSSANPVLLYDGTRLSAITSNVALGATTISVADSSKFEPGMPVEIEDGSHWFIGRVKKISSSTQIELYKATPVGIAAATGYVSAVTYDAVAIKNVIYRDGGFYFTVSCIRLGIAHLEELSVAAYGNSLTDIHWDYEAGLLAPLSSAESLDSHISRENVCVVDLWAAGERESPASLLVSDTSTVDLSVLDNRLSADVIPGGIPLDDLGDPSNNTDLDVSVSRHGLAPKGMSGHTRFWREDWTLAAPDTGSGEVLMQDGVTSPPIPLETEDGSDWLFADVGA